jgi:hypothetical protein
VHPDNTVWLAAVGSNRSSGSIQRRKQFTIYDVPVGVKNNKNATPYGMAVGDDGNILVRGECVRPDCALLTARPASSTSIRS